MAINSYVRGTEITCCGEFRDSDEQLANPTTVTVEISDPDGNKTSYAPTNIETGVYQYKFTPDRTGSWFYRFVGTGAVKAAGRKWFGITEDS